MIEIVTPDAYGVYEQELNQMFKLRHQIFKDRLRWDVPSDGGLERDQFDELNPTYVLALDDRTDDDPRRFPGTSRGKDAAEQ